MLGVGILLGGGVAMSIFAGIFSFLLGHIYDRLCRIEQQLAERGHDLSADE